MGVQAETWSQDLPSETREMRGGTCEKRGAWEANCHSHSSSEMVSRTCTQLPYKMRLRGGEERTGWGEGLRPRAAPGCKKINTMNSFSISLAHRALYTPLAAHQLPGAGPSGPWLELCSLTPLGAFACLWGLLIHAS